MEDVLLKQKKRLFYMFVLSLFIFLWFVYILLLSENSFVNFELLKRSTSQEKEVLKVADHPFDVFFVSSSKSLQLRNYPNKLVPGTILKGYELKEKTALLGVCDHQLDYPHVAMQMITTSTTSTTSISAEEEETQSKSLQKYDPHHHDSSIGDKNTGIPPSCPLVGLIRPPLKRKEEEEELIEQLIQGQDLLQEGPSLEYQCLFEEEELKVVYINENYRLRKKFDGGSHGEVWRATKPEENGQVFVLKRMFVELGEHILRSGLREVHFGTLLKEEPHVTRFVEHFFHTPTGGTGGQEERGEGTEDGHFSSGQQQQEERQNIQELWLVFYDEGISLRNYLYSKRPTSSGAFIMQPSIFWRKLRTDVVQGDVVLKEMMRQMLESLASLHAKGITHRDIKPSNILLNTEFSPPLVKLADFGSAVDGFTLLHQAYGLKGPSQAEETREYQPPEVVFNEMDVPYDMDIPTSYDIWSMGVVFLEIILGNPQVFVLDLHVRAKLDLKLNEMDDNVKRKSYFLYALRDFCIVPQETIPPTTFTTSTATSETFSSKSVSSTLRMVNPQVDMLLNKYALLSNDRKQKETNCHFGQFNQTILTRDPFHRGLTNPWGLNLLWRLLQWHPTKRLTAQEALEHAFFKGPYVCPTTGREFATLKELNLHLDYLKVEAKRKEQQEQNPERKKQQQQLQKNVLFNFVLKEKYDLTKALPNQFECPQCHRVFTHVDACLQHVHARRHFKNDSTHFCHYDNIQLTQIVQEQTLKFLIPVQKQQQVKVDNTQELEEEEVESNNNHVLYGKALFQGRRPYMEDLLVIIPKASYQERPFQIYAVVDGHLGHKAAHFVQDNLLNFMLKAFDKMHPLLSSTHKKKDTISQQEKDHVVVWDQLVVHETFTQLNDAFLASLDLNEEEEDKKKLEEDVFTLKDFSGCTLTVVVYFPVEKRLLSANVGDSRAILLTKKSTTIRHHGFQVDTLSMDHVPQQVDERQRIESSGGFIKKQGLWRVMGQLAVSRSIGDRHLRQYVSSEPSIFHHQVVSSSNRSDKTCPLDKQEQQNKKQQQQFALLATDGLWEVMSTEQVSTFIWDQLSTRVVHKANCKGIQITPQVLDEIAQLLVVEAFVRGSSDNIGVLLLALN